ncbi:MAG: DAK2 domain-containing protein, partial [Actinobacteria bacterium]|nr:DAK2 domain-containing protein [Actinomycetota bacterium]NIS33766.1 DAK2 domain-containing protein [Actinomycetota bacterium]NIW30437.1 DAK2 domain-containing protein [Actinomycetota bacterium]
AAEAAGEPLARVALAAVEAASEALERTPEQLDVLKRAGVVDAGGRGLTVVLAAFDTVLTGRRPLPRARELASRDLPEVALVEPRSSYSGPAFEVMYL